MSAKQARNTMLEQLYDYSNKLMELALEETEIPVELLRSVIREATLHQLITPVLCGSALDRIGVQPVLDAVANYLPSPKDLPAITGINPRQGDQKTERIANPEEPFCGLVFKVEAEKTGDLAYVRVYSGVLEAGTTCLQPRQGQKRKCASTLAGQTGWKGSASRTC